MFSLNIKNKNITNFIYLDFESIMCARDHIFFQEKKTKEKQDCLFSIFALSFVVGWLAAFNRSAIRRILVT